MAIEKELLDQLLEGRDPESGIHLRTVCLTS